MSTPACCNKPVINSFWYYGFESEPRERQAIIKLDNMHCKNCGARFVFELDNVVVEASADHIVLRIRNIGRPS